jgi:RND family efflux transporter MFP subunit
VAVIAAAAVAYVFLVPGSTETLSRFGITLPVEAATPAEQTPAAGQPGRRQAGPGRGGRGGDRTMVVATAPVAGSTINDKLTAIGEGTAAHSVTVMSPATGTLAELLAQPGDIVEAGTIIARLDDDAEQIAAERARLALADAEAALARTQELAQANSATTVQLNAAQLAVGNARLELQNAELALSRRSIVSPIPGTVGLFQVSAGNSANAQSIVTTIEDTSHIVVSFWLPERYAPAIVPGMSVSASAVALPGRTLAGEVSAIDNRIDPASRTLKVQARVPNESGVLRPGMSFSVTLTFPGDEFPSVDPLAIQWSSDGAYVWKFSDGKVERLPVEIIQRNSDGVLVKAELAAGDQVVTQGVQQLSPGAEVRLLDAFLAERSQAAGNGEGRS